jgi:pantothenate synthetase
MSNSLREERQAMVDRGEAWKFGDEKRLLFPITREEDILQLPGRLAFYSGDKDRAKRRAILAAMRQGFRLPKTWAREVAALAASEGEMINNERERAERATFARALRDAAERVERGASFDDRDDEIAESEIRRQAEQYAEQVNARGQRPLPPVSAGSDDAAAIREAEAFAERHNRRLRRAHK